MAFFNEFTVNLKQKWLQYYQVNRNWLVLQMDLNRVPTPDGGRRPASSLILGTINALDPDAAQLMMPFSQLNPDPDKLVEVLGLNFDPDIALGNPPTSRSTAQGMASPAISMPPTPPPVAEPPMTPEIGISGMAAAAMGGAAIASALDETEAQLEMDLDADDDLGMDLDAGDDLAVDDELVDLKLDDMEDADSDDLTQLESIDSSDDFDLGELDLDDDLGGDDATSDDLDDLDLGDLGDDDDLGELSTDDLDEMNLDDLGEITTGDLDDIDLEGLTDAPDDDGDISLSDLK